MNVDLGYLYRWLLGFIIKRIKRHTTSTVASDGLLVNSTVLEFNRPSFQNPRYLSPEYSRRYAGWKT